jgi:hypothetical protein
MTPYNLVAVKVACALVHAANDAAQKAIARADEHNRKAREARS